MIHCLHFSIEKRFYSKTASKFINFPKLPIHKGYSTVKIQTVKNLIKCEFGIFFILFLLFYFKTPSVKFVNMRPEMSVINERGVNLLQFKTNIS